MLRPEVQRLVDLSRAPLHPNGEADDEISELDAGIQDLPRITTSAWNAVKAANSPARLFRHGNACVRIEPDDHGTLILRELTQDRLRHEVARVVPWCKVNRKGQRREAKPPVDVIRDMLATPDPPLPVLDRLIYAPCFAADGSLIQTPGYDAASRLYLYLDGNIHVPEVAPCPGEQDIAQARHLLLEEVLRDFPFVGQADRAGACGLFVASFARELIAGPTPNHLFDAPTAGTGKGLCADAVLRPAFGEHLGVIGAARDDAEWRKALTSLFLAGHSVIKIDNVTRPLDSGSLAAALTGYAWDDRVLKTNDMISLPIRCLWVTTGNNIAVSLEMARRSVWIRLDAKTERPWEHRTFHHKELLPWIDEHRGELIWAGLTLVQAWLAAERPEPSTRTLGGFEQWSRIIGGILKVAGIPGFLQNLDTFYDTVDTEGAVWRTFVEKWWDTHKDTVVSVQQLFSLALEIESFSFGKAEKERGQRTVLGQDLRKRKDQVIGGYQIEEAGTYGGGAQWRLRALAPNADEVDLRENGHAG